MTVRLWVGILSVVCLTDGSNLVNVGSGLIAPDGELLFSLHFPPVFDTLMISAKNSKRPTPAPRHFNT